MGSYFCCKNQEANKEEATPLTTLRFQQQEQEERMGLISEFLQPNTLLLMEHSSTKEPSLTLWSAE